MEDLMLKMVISHNITGRAMKTAKTTMKPARRKSHPVKRERLKYL
uniref:Alternative protein PSIP1 n=1 Tax=Homo sapiens TaxID=9606 RepID=L8E926_HUMAN|nr:alternative protein PSIP1 [Homo sapiens]